MGLNLKQGAKLDNIGEFYSQLTGGEQQSSYIGAPGISVASVLVSLCLALHIIKRICL